LQANFHIIQTLIAFCGGKRSRRGTVTMETDFREAK